MRPRIDEEIRQTGLFVIIFLFCASMVLMLFLTFLETAKQFAIFCGILMGVFFIIAILVFIRYLILKRRKREHILSLFGTPEKQRKKLRKNINFTPEIFTDENIETKCMICKLRLMMNDVFIKCPFCDSKFHSIHLLEWLKLDDTCPVCDKSLKK